MAGNRPPSAPGNFDGKRSSSPRLGAGEDDFRRGEKQNQNESIQQENQAKDCTAVSTQDEYTNGFEMVELAAAKASRGWKEGSDLGGGQELQVSRLKAVVEAGEAPQTSQLEACSRSRRPNPIPPNVGPDGALWFGGRSTLPDWFFQGGSLRPATPRTLERGKTHDTYQKDSHFPIRSTALFHDQGRAPYTAVQGRNSSHQAPQTRRISHHGESTLPYVRQPPVSNAIPAFIDPVRPLDPVCSPTANPQPFPLASVAHNPKIPASRHQCDSATNRPTRHETTAGSTILTPSSAAKSTRTPETEYSPSPTAWNSGRQHGCERTAHENSKRLTYPECSSALPSEQRVGVEPKKEDFGVGEGFSQQKDEEEEEYSRNIIDDENKEDEKTKDQDRGNETREIAD